MSTYLDALNWRYATKAFDPSKKITADQLDHILEAGRLAASSFGLQPYHFFVVEDPALREALKAASWNQSQVTDASHLIVIAHASDFGDELVDDYLARSSAQRNIPIDGIAKYGDFMKGYFKPLPAEVKAMWAAKQSYIVLGNMMSAAALLNIDSCPMEGFEPTKYNELLDLDDKNLSASVILTVGHRAESDDTQHLAKVRKAKSDIVSFV